jgi:5-methylcytosine-specific restriction endonuclease McrA
LVEYVAVAGWVDCTETFSSSPKLFTILSGERPRRGSLAKWKHTLATLQKHRCFYCEGAELRKPEVDHVLPWSYVLEDRTWNLVLSCDECNGSKSNRLPGVS